MKSREEQILEFEKEPIKSGDPVYIGKEIHTVVKVENDMVFYQKFRSTEKISISEVRKFTGHIGYNPFNDTFRNIETMSFSLESILHRLGLLKQSNKSEFKTNKGFDIKSVNFNPFVELNGEKEYYQRPLVWTLQDKQNLIHSIYNRLSCGKIVIRNRGWNWLESRDNEDECYWTDVVDGKQRLNTIVEFINNEFPDKNGVYYNDFSSVSKRKFTDHQLFTYQEMNDTCTDEEILEQFLLVNFAGVPQSEDHLQFVEKILKRN